ncbi:MAG: hypothetical protein ABWX73_03350 [Marmoricola sp.]
MVWRVGGLVVGALVGLFFGVLARALMRLVAIGMAIEPELDRGATAALVSLFVVSGAGAGAGAAFRLRTWRLALVLVLSSAPLFLMGVAFGVGEVIEIIDLDLTLPWMIELLALSGVIVAVVLVTPYAAWRAGRRTVRGR